MTNDSPYTSIILAFIWLDTTVWPEFCWGELRQLLVEMYPGEWFCSLDGKDQVN